MEQNKNDFLTLTCKLYMIALLAWIPLYTGGTYWNLGDTKYRIFQSVSLLCLGIWGIMTLGSLVQYKGRDRGRLSCVDGCMLFYEEDGHVEKYYVLNDYVTIKQKLLRSTM